MFLSFFEALRQPTSLQKGCESSLLEVMVASQRFGDLSFLHNKE
jgi:hypothetical protein